MSLFLLDRTVNHCKSFRPGTFGCKQWIEDRLKELVGVFAVELAGFALMDNHLHLLVRLDSKKAREWSVDEVVRRWLSIFPLRDTAGKALPVSQARVELLAQDAGWVAKVRKRLGDLSWFMKCMKEPLDRLANREEGCSGAFWIRPSSGKRPAWCLRHTSECIPSLRA